MNKTLLKTGPQEFIKNNWNTDILSFLLKKPIFDTISQKELAEQLEAKKKCRHKLPTWFNTTNIYYPNKFNIEQTSSEITAEYKSRLVHGTSLLDMTGGFGVDSFYFSKKTNGIVHCELNKNLSEMAAHNFKQLGINNCDFINEDGVAFLKSEKPRFDWIYVDPSRRHDSKGKVFRLKDCEPNIPQNLELIFQHTDSILLKTSPLLDLNLAIKELKNVSQIHIVAVKNEVKEVLFILRKEVQEPINIKTVDLSPKQEVYFAFVWDEEKMTQVAYGNPGKYLYEPNSAILKAGAFKSIGSRFRVKKIAPHSHLYTGKEQIDFPGRTFTVQEVLPYNKKAMKALVGTKANITTRNFPETVAEIRKKYKILDGGEDYLFFTTTDNRNCIVIRCIKVL
ncbi:MAG: class I SAM-dependent methyltransferase [Bacteroidota bacterium]